MLDELTNACSGTKVEMELVAATNPFLVALLDTYMGIFETVVK